MGTNTTSRIRGVLLRRTATLHEQKRECPSLPRSAMNTNLLDDSEKSIGPYGKQYRRGIRWSCNKRFLVDIKPRILLSALELCKFRIHCFPLSRRPFVPSDTSLDASNVVLHVAPVEITSPAKHPDGLQPCATNRRREVSHLRLIDFCITQL